MFILAYNKDLSFNGFYRDGIHKSVPSPNIDITKELWSYLLSLGSFKIKEGTVIEDRIYTKKDIDIFENVVIEQPVPEPSRTDLLEEQNAQMLLDLAQKDSALEAISADNAQLIMDSAIKDSKVEELDQTVSQLILEIAKGGN